jgi:hypothetical protein
MTMKKLTSAAVVAAGAIVVGAVVGQSGSGRAAPPTPSGCPDGQGTVQVKDLTMPARLMIQRQSIVPAEVTASTDSIELHFLVTACNGRPVQGADVFAVPIPYNQFSGEHGTTGADGTVSITESRLSGFPASRRQQLLAVLARASKPGEPIVGGISTRRAVSFPVSLG